MLLITGSLAISATILLMVLMGTIPSMEEKETTLSTVAMAMILYLEVMATIS
jgi:hypothetical protein